MNGNLVELLIRGKADELAVGRPKRPLCALGVAFAEFYGNAVVGDGLADHDGSNSSVVAIPGGVTSQLTSYPPTTLLPGKTLA